MTAKTKNLICWCACAAFWIFMLVADVHEANRRMTFLDVGGLSLTTWLFIRKDRKTP